MWSNYVSMYTATITNQGQLTLPAAMRRQGNFVPGDKVVFISKPNGESTFEMAKIGNWESLRGILKKYTKIRRYPTQKDIAKAWASGYMGKWLRNEKSSR